MSDRVCIACGAIMQPVKNGYFFVHQGKAYVSDLWGCKSCKRFQLHGFHSPGTAVSLIDDTAEIIEDPGNATMFAILDPEFITWPDGFQEHMDKWYPHFEWKEE